MCQVAWRFSACFAGGLIEAGTGVVGADGRRRRRFPPVLQAASLKHRRPGRAFASDASFPPVLQAALLKRMDEHGTRSMRLEFSACFAGGLIEARCARLAGGADSRVFRLFCRRPH